MTMVNPTPLELALLKVANCLSDPLLAAGVEVVSKDNSGPITEDITWSKYGLVVDGTAITLTIGEAEPVEP